MYKILSSILIVGGLLIAMSSILNKKIEKETMEYRSDCKQLDASLVKCENEKFVCYMHLQSILKCKVK